jgi:hypothetical protein
MRAIGIDIDKTKAIFYVLEKIQDGTVHNITGKTKTLVLKDETDQQSVISFLQESHALLATWQADTIAIKARQTKGKFSASPLSFKLEALLQAYAGSPIRLIAPATVNAFFKKNEFPLVPDHNYQEDAAKIAFYQLHS